MARNQSCAGHRASCPQRTGDRASVRPSRARDRGHSGKLFILGLLSASAATVAAGSYFAQPVAYLISRDLGISALFAGLIVTFSQIGYVLGLLFLMPLGDLVESRRLLAALMSCSIACLLGAALAPDGLIFLVACLGIGMSSISVQVLVMLASFISLPERRGRAVGTVTSGLLIGILLAFPVATIVSAHLGWRMLYGLDALVLSAFSLVLFCFLPRRVPSAEVPYAGLVISLWRLWKDTPELRQRAIRQAFLFFGFSLYWTAVPVELRGQLGLRQGQIALFGLVGGSGALVAAIAGRAADAGKGRITSLLGLAAVTIAFLMTVFSQPIWLLCMAAIGIGAGVQANHVVSQRAILTLRSGAESRLNALYVAVFFAGGAIGSASSGALLAFGWPTVGITGMALGLAAFALPGRQVTAQRASTAQPSSARAD
jgi:predicted MFS family arabinose efflux permease